MSIEVLFNTQDLPECDLVGIDTDCRDGAMRNNK
jgi:hypothetical protein